MDAFGVALEGEGRLQCLDQRTRLAGLEDVASPGSTPQPQERRVLGMPLEPSSSVATPSTWCTAMPPSSKPTAEAAM